MDSTVTGQHAIIGNSKCGLILENKHPDAQWFLKGGNLGMFIHWGIASVDGHLDLSWPMLAHKSWDKPGTKHTVTAAYYFDLAKEFKPRHFDADKIIKSAAEGGCTYAVLTARHHEGFALWPSNYGDFNTKNYFGGVDLVRPFVDACNKYGLKVGLYYSPPDWYRERKYKNFNCGRPYYDIYHHPVHELPKKPDGWNEEEAKYVGGQVRELLTKYGKIDIIWFDGTISLRDEAISIDEIRALQPGIVINPRMHKKGDFEVYESADFLEKKPGVPWECNTTWTEFSWGYNEDALPTYRTAQWAVDKYDKVMAWGGNLLLNVTPDKDGQLPQIAYERIAEMKIILDKRKK